jgi:hypothetical protein
MGTELTLTGSINNLLESYADTAQAITEQLSQGTISVGQWQRQMREVIKQARASAIYHGRADRPMGLGQRINAAVRNFWDTQKQFNYLRGFAQQIRSGALDDPRFLGRTLARARMYIKSAGETFFKEMTGSAKEQGYTEKRRVLNPAEHCPDCVAQAELGWVPIDDPSVTAPRDGSTQCLGNCQCDMEYR